ncbi:MAG: hypothetical protein NZZ41_02640 [Candidatus Dojkabacteria bacterium]|nr:hypothetical protein [Candidatus Dojkabacteria bacterium]
MLIERLTSKIKLLENSNQFIKKNVKYPLPKLFVEKFGDVARIDIENPIEIGDNGTVYKAYPKFLMEKSIMNDEVIKGFYGTVGMIVNYSSNKLIVYSGATARACLNLSIFGADYVVEYSLLDSVESLNDILAKATNNLSVHLNHIRQVKEKLESKQYSPIEFEHRKGEILSKMDLSLLPYLKHAEEQFRSKDSLYFDMPNSDWKLLSAMTDLVKDKGVTARISKTLKLEELFV